jgi:radical SAM protein with 4Fe4S-binding SPASM domain
MKNLLVYLKTTETCNLNCKHCFTNGSNGAKIYWDHLAVADWIQRLKLHNPNYDMVHFEFHGGEPFLAPLSTLKYVYEQSNGLWKNMSWGITTNLVFKLTDDKISFIKNELNSRLGTSWDPDIRFSNPRQYDLWRKNVKLLLDLGVNIKLFVSVTKGTIKIEPIELLMWVKELGVKEFSLERLTKNGSALMHPEIFPSNIEQDAWFLKMHEQIIEYDTRNWFENEFFENIYDKFEIGFTKGGTFCRDCEEKLLTLNADGSIAGCPNSAPEDHFGHINMDISELLNSPKRLNNIACERNRDSRCYDCEVFQYCGGDCHQLDWQDDICPAPKSVMVKLSSINKKTIFIRKEKWH